jgi:hypothetical protein
MKNAAKQRVSRNAKPSVGGRRQRMAASVARSLAWSHKKLSKETITPAIPKWIGCTKNGAVDCLECNAQLAVSCAGLRAFIERKSENIGPGAPRRRFEAVRRAIARGYVRYASCADAETCKRCASAKPDAQSCAGLAAAIVHANGSVR